MTSQRPKRPPLNALLVIAGATAVVVGAWWVSPPAGLVIAGFALILLGWPS